MFLNHYISALLGLSIRETRKFTQQKGRLFSAIVRPALWLFVFAAGVGTAKGIDPGILNFYPTQNVNYFEYITPGLLGMVLLFSSMQSSLSMVYDREMGVMKILLTTPLPRWYMLISKLLAGTILSVIQAYSFLIICVPIINIYTPFVTSFYGWIYAFPFIVLFSLMLGSLGLFLSVHIKQLENFAGTMNFVIFPMFFISSALYPLWRLIDNGALFIYYLAKINPFTYGVEIIRAASSGKFYYQGIIIVFLSTCVFILLAIKGYNPQNSIFKKLKKK
ncbi:MAG: multidrug ABC transporter permease [Rickettsiales bacterium]|nr:multidrug ABC transporter permease [Rickettsiales bacterium]|tara:strand:+ start:17 stop:847 length:831 start_codon:yes stop_codon:yes gene_type:complete